MLLFAHKINPERLDSIMSHWLNKNQLLSDEELSFQKRAKVRGFYPWLQKTADSHIFIRGVDGDDESVTFKAICEMHREGNPIAQQMVQAYSDNFGFDYLDPDAHPKVESISSFELGTSQIKSDCKMAFCAPIPARTDMSAVKEAFQADGGQELFNLSVDQLRLVKIERSIQSFCDQRYVLTYVESAFPRDLFILARQRFLDQHVNHSWFSHYHKLVPPVDVNQVFSLR